MVCHDTSSWHGLSQVYIFCREPASATVRGGSCWQWSYRGVFKGEVQGDASQMSDFQAKKTPKSTSAGTPHETPLESFQRLARPPSWI